MIIFLNYYINGRPAYKREPLVNTWKEPDEQFESGNNSNFFNFFNLKNKNNYKTGLLISVHITVVCDNI